MLKRAAFNTTRLSDNDPVEIVNFVASGSPPISQTQADATTSRPESSSAMNFLVIAGGGSVREGRGRV